MSRPATSIPELHPGTQLWVPAPKSHADVFQRGKVLVATEATATVRIDDAKTKSSRVIQLDLMTNQPMVCNSKVEQDMTSLHHVHEAGILYNLEQRALADKPYTFMGSVLVSVNPLKSIPDPSVGSPSCANGPPHPYAVAEVSFQQMCFQGMREKKSGAAQLTRANQSIVVGGESGAGKTEASKMILAHLVTRAGGGESATSSKAGLDKRLLGTNPILEAFGNAVTLRNPNSSRFGKMLRLHFTPPAAAEAPWGLRGATVQSYLLERSRVTQHDAGEGSFHVFYYMLSCAKTSKELFDLGLETPDPNAYRYTKPVPPGYANTSVDGFEKLVQALDIVGVSPFLRRGAFELLAALLHLGNVEFSEKDTNDGATSFVSNPPVLEQAASLLGLDPEALSGVFCERRFMAGGTQVVAKRNARAASYARDAAVKALYSNLFDWLIKRVNEALDNEEGQGTKSSASTMIGVLDIFGFESFQVNGFEQLLINYANEALQGTFNAQIFVAEAALYQREGLFGTDEYLTQPVDNSLCVELLQGSKSDLPTTFGANVSGLAAAGGSLFSLLDTEGRSPDCSDAKFNQRLHATFGNNPAMIRPHPKDAARTFIVRHYAGPVVYTVGTFLEKNNDRLPDDMDSVFSTSSKAAVKELFDASSAAAAAQQQRAAPASKKPQGPPNRSIVHKFSASIRALVFDLEETKCSFVRCIKPNPNMMRVEGDATWFDRQYVTSQLHALNIPQTAEVLRNGFPNRVEYAALVESYAKLLPKECMSSYLRTRDDKSFVRALFWAFGVSDATFKLGATRVFFKSGDLAELDRILQVEVLPQDLPTRFRLYYARVKWRRAATLVLCASRFQKLGERVRRRHAAAIRIQAVVRRRSKRKHFVALQHGARTIQRIARGRKGRAKAATRRAERIAEARAAAEEARRRKDQAAAEAAFIKEKEAREAEIKAKADAEAKSKEVVAALSKQFADRKTEAFALAAKRRQSSDAIGILNGVRRSTLRLSQASESTDAGTRSSMGSRGSLRSRTMVSRRAMSVTGAGARIRAPTQEDAEEWKAQYLAQVQANAADLGEDALAELPSRKRSHVMLATEAAARRRASRRVSNAVKAGGDKSVKFDKSVGRRGGEVGEARGAALIVEGKSALEKIASANRNVFGIPVMGFVHLLRNPEVLQPPPKTSGPRMLLGLFGGGKPAPSASTSGLLQKWERVFFVLDKPSRSLVFYTDGTRAKVIKTLVTRATMKVVDFPHAKFAVELRDPHDGSTYLANESAVVKTQWERDLREAIIGPSVVQMGLTSAATSSQQQQDDFFGDDRVSTMLQLYAAQLRQERVAQLRQLLKVGRITQEEFDDACEAIARAADPLPPALAEELDADVDVADEDFGAQVACPKCGTSNNTLNGRYNCVRCRAALPKPERGVGETEEEFADYASEDKRKLAAESVGGDALERSDGAVLGLKPAPLKRAFAKEMSYRDGRVSVQLSGVASHMNPTTFEEVSLFALDVRFRDEHDKNLEIGWTLSNQLRKFKDLCDDLTGPNSPLKPAARKKIPPFPNIVAATMKGDEVQRAVLESLEKWLAALFKNVPSGGKSVKFVDDAAAAGPPLPDKPAHLLPSAWRSVKDATSGELYYFNQITGETRWTDPFEGEAAIQVAEYEAASSADLPPGWELVQDGDEQYYWNGKAGNDCVTQWERPTNHKSNAPKTLYEAKDLLQCSIVADFLDLPANIARLDQMGL